MKVLTIAAAVTALALGTVAGATAAVSESSQRTPKANIVKTAASAGQFTTLAKLLKTAGLAGALQRKGPYTVFAPTDAAFAKVPKSTLNALAKDRAALRSVLLYHVVSGKVTASKVVKLKSAKTLNGQRVAIRVRNGSVFVSGARVTAPDVMASNGVIHVVNRVLIPKAA